MRTGLAGLAFWSFLMATAHGAGLMILLALMPLCLTGSPLRDVGGDQSAAMATAAVSVHARAMSTVTSVIALAVYRWVGLEILRHAWINVDLLWTLFLIATGAAPLIL